MNINFSYLNNVNYSMNQRQDIKVGLQHIALISSAK